jgi:putative ABC transport system ATP-binding protein
MSQNILIDAKAVKKSYGKTEALRGVNISIESGEMVAIMGPSGSGKTTLLLCLAGIEQPDAGTIMYRGKNIPDLGDTERTILRRTDFAFVFQFGQLVPELSAVDNVAIPLLLNGVAKRNAYAQAQAMLKEVGLQSKESNLPGELSGGQAQRVAVARAMVIEPEVLFADEPTGSLDSYNSEQIMDLFVSIVKKHNTTIIIVTHEPYIAAYADREVIVRDGLIK